MAMPMMLNILPSIARVLFVFVSILGWARSSLSASLENMRPGIARIGKIKTEASPKINPHTARRLTDLSLLASFFVFYLFISLFGLFARF
jgi:hypothetical protein